MKYFIKIILLFVLITPKCSIAQYSDACSDLSRQQIIDSIKVHPNLKYDLKYKCFKKLRLNDINTIYGENDSLKMIIGKYKSKHKLTTAGMVMLSLALIDIISLPIIFNNTEYPISEGLYFITGVSLYPFGILGSIFYFVGPRKIDLFISLRKYHREHQVK